MNKKDFIKLNGLISKLTAAANKAASKDGCFKKYHNGSLSAIKNLPLHLKHLEQGMRTIKAID